MKSFPDASVSFAARWGLVAMLWFVCFLNYADRQAIFSVFPLIQTQMHLSVVQLGIVGSSFMWVYALVGPFAGWVCDRLSRRLIVLTALVFWSLITAATALTHSLPTLIVCRALGGLGEAFYFPAAMSLIGDCHPAASRSRAMAFHQSGVYAGTIAGGALSGLLGQTYGWRSSFRVFGAAGLLLALLLSQLLWEPRRGMSEPTFSPASLEGVVAAQPDRTPLDGLLDLARNGMVLLLVVVFMAANFVAVVFLTWMPTVLFEKFHMTLAMAGFSSAAYMQIASVVGVLLGGFLADSLQKTTAGGRLRTQSLGLLCGVPFLFLTGWTATTSWLILGLAGFGFCKGIYDANIFAGLYEVVPVRQRGSAAGVLNSMGWLGGGFAPLLIALAATHFGISLCLSATAAIYLLIGILLLLAARNQSARTSPPRLLSSQSI